MARRNMGFFYGFDTSCFKRKFRWMFTLEGVSGDPNPSSPMLPPSKSARPNITFKEIEVQHLNETVYYPGKPDWKPISITLYDNSTIKNPVFEYIKKYYNPRQGTFSYSDQLKIPRAILEMYSGCGNVIEYWIFENVWPQQIEFGELDMSESAIMTIDLTLRYDRAYIDNAFVFDSTGNDDFNQSNNFTPSLPPNLSQPDFPNGDLIDIRSPYPKF